MELEEELYRILLERHWHITTVESCTGGLIAGRIINVPGASDVLKEAYVTYCDEAKHKLAGVRNETLEKYTAVSRQTAAEMAEGGAEAAGAEVALSATGIAGPGGGSEEFPVGLVYIGCRVPGRTVVRKLQLDGSRSEIRSQAVEEALKLALDCLNHADCR